MCANIRAFRVARGKRNINEILIAHTIGSYHWVVLLVFRSRNLTLKFICYCQRVLFPSRFQLRECQTPVMWRERATYAGHGSHGPAECDWSFWASDCTD